MFLVLILKTEVELIENDIQDITSAIKEERSSLHILRAELAYLQNPARIKSLSKKHLNLKAIKDKDIIDYK